MLRVGVRSCFLAYRAWAVEASGAVMGEQGRHLLEGVRPRGRPEATDPKGKAGGKRTNCSKCLLLLPTPLCELVSRAQRAALLVLPGVF